MKIIRRSKKDQARDAELDLIVADMVRAMWQANKAYVASQPVCSCVKEPRFTLSMKSAWAKYVDFCRKYPNG